MRISRETLKAETAALRRQAEPIWKALEGLEDRERDQRAFESSLVHFEQQRLCITVMGEFNTGKSTLLNAFIGEDLLATDQLECTAVPTWVRWSDEESFDENRPATVVYANGDTDAMPLSEVSARTTLDEDAWETIERVEVALPVESERQLTGLVLVDTPGLNGNTELEARSMHQLGMSHVTIVVVPVDGIGRKSDAELIKKARSIADRVMVVINKCDQYAKMGDEFEQFREELRRRVPDLPREDIYTLSAKRAFEGGAYCEGEQELENEEVRFKHDLRKSALEDPTSALRRRPLLLLREICKAEIERIKKIEKECGAERELEEAKKQLKEAEENLQNSLEKTRQLARETLMEELRILSGFLDKEKFQIEREMMGFVDGLGAELLEQENLDLAQKNVSEWLKGRMQKSIFNRVSRLLEAAARRLAYDLEVRAVAPLNVGKVSIQLDIDTAVLKQHADKASEVLSRREDEISRLKREVTRCERAVQMREAEIETLKRQSAQLENLETQRKKAVRNRTQLGPKPTPKVENYTAYETKKVKRGGLGFLDWLLGPKEEEVAVQRQRKDYSRVEEWERKFKAADKKVSDLERKIAPLKNMRTEMQKARGELPKLQREADNTKARLRRAEARLAEERERYRQAGIKTRQAQLKASTRRELESLFASLPDGLEWEAEQMLEEILRDFIKHFKKNADRQHKLLADEIERRRAEARAADAERVNREGVRKTLEEALETFLNEDQGERT